jgi:PST family polysaccharide transporter
MGNNYNAILKASSLIGGAQGVSLVVGMARVKFAAVLIGTAGVGLLGAYQSFQALAATVAGLGLQSSAVREIALAASESHSDRLAHLVLALRRFCLLAGIAGCVLVAAFSVPISQLTFGNDDHALEIVILGIPVLFTVLQGGQMAVIQGLRKIGSLARLNVFGAVFGTILSIGLYTWLGVQGILPSLVGMGVITLLLSSWQARQIKLPKVVHDWSESFRLARGFVGMGLAFMWSGLMVAAVAYLTRVLVVQSHGLEGAGLFSAAFNLSGMFVGFVLSSMSADYFPRLTAVFGDRGSANQLVNEQTEIALLLAVPGLLATLTFAPWIVRLLYTKEFLPAAPLLQWFVLGCLGRVISWPMGFLMLAAGKSRWFVISETGAGLLHLAAVWFGLALWGLTGTGIAFCVLYVVYTCAMVVVSRSLTGFAWSKRTTRLILFGLTAVLGLFILAYCLPPLSAFVSGAVLTGLGSLFCIRELCSRLSDDHRLKRLLISVGLRLSSLRRVYGTR